MKPRSSNPFLPTLLLCAAPVITLTSASGDVLNFNEANATNLWDVPAGTNLLNGATAVPITVSTQEGSSPSWTTLTDGVLGEPGDNSKTVTPANGETVTFPLDIVAQPVGYDLTSIDSYCTWANSGRSNQNFSVQVSTVADPANFSTIAVVNNADASTNRSTHTRLTDTTGVLASGVHSVRFVFGSPNGQENGYVGMSEIKVMAVPTNVVTLIEASNGNSFTLPSGTNLLNGNNAIPASTATNEGSSANWSTVTNGALAAASDISSSVTPPNMDSVVFPLNLSVNFNGYNISSFDSYCSWPNSGRDNQDFRVSYSTVADPNTFTLLGTVVAHTGEPLNATHVRLTPATGFLATNVAALRIDFGHQENGYVGYREFVALGTAVSTSDPLTWTGNSGSGGNASWVNSPDNNWKQTAGGIPANFNSLAPLTFDSTGNNRNINIPAPLTASSLNFSNGAGANYTIGGQLLTVSNDVTLSGAGNATFSNSVLATAGVTLSGSGNLSFNGPLEGEGLTVSGTGNLTLGGSNPALIGNASVTNGTLTVANNSGLQSAALVATGGITRFTSAAPLVPSIAGALGSSIVLGNSTGPVNTNLTVGTDNAAVSTSFEGDISVAAGATGRLTKTGASSLTLSGNNTYTGPTSVDGGFLEFTQRNSLYNGNDSSWTASNLLVSSGATLTLKVGSFDEADLNTGIALGGFQSGSMLGIDTDDDFTLSRNLTQPGAGLYKLGTGILSVTGNNSDIGQSKLIGGTINAASSGTALGSVHLGNAVANVFLNMGGNNQFAPGAVISAANGSFYQSKINLRGTSQTVGGLDSAPFPVNYVTLVQNDEIGQPGYNGNPGPASLTIDTSGTHSFYGLIRNMDGDAVSVTKTGTGTQEFINMATVQGFGYTGPTTIENGTLRLNFNGGNTSFPSNVTVNEPGVLEFDGTFTFAPTISGDGDVVKQGSGTVTLSNAAFSYNGTTKVLSGILSLVEPALSNLSTVEIADAAVLNLQHSGTDAVSGLKLGDTVMPEGIYAATGNGGPGITETPFITGTGRLEVAEVTEISYDTWALIIPNAADRDRTDDPDLDGFSNLHEFLFGTSPNVVNGSLTPTELTGSGLVIRWYQRALGGTYGLKESSTLLDNPWPASAATITDDPVQDRADYLQKRAVIPVTEIRKFFRVEATE